MSSLADQDRRAHSRVCQVFACLQHGSKGVDDERCRSLLRFFPRSFAHFNASQATAAFTSQVLLGLPPSYGRVALSNTKVRSILSFSDIANLPNSQDISIEDVVRVIKKYIQPIFDPANSIGGIAVGAAKVDEMAEHFSKLGYEVEKRAFVVGDDDDEDEPGSEGESEASA